LVVGVDVDQNEIGNCRCELDDNPLAFVISVQADSVLWFKVEVLE
jgi:hypothetical protein